MPLKSNTKTKQSQADQNGRIDFARGVPEILFRRAGGDCSVPRCKNPTMGPLGSDDTAVNMGMACHIFSAAANGPRGREGKSVEYISSAENGIWCCHYHGTLIDKAKGKDYSAETLLAWKNLAEARVLKRMNDIPSPLGWVDSIEFTEFAGREGLPKIKLSRNTLLLGENGAGKSVLMEIAASVSNAKFGERFFGTIIKSAAGSSESAVFSANVIYSTVDSHGKKINIEVRNDTLTRTEGVVPCLLPPGDIEIILASDRVLRRQDSEDDVDFMMRLLDIDKTALYSLAKLGTKSVMPGEIEFSQVFDDNDEGEGEAFARMKENGEPYIELIFRKTGKKHRATFAGLSGSEQVRLIVDLFISKAREVCKQRLTLLMIDDIISGFDDSNFSNLLNKLTEENFQSIVMLPPGRRKEVLEYTNEVPRLKSIEYLKPWRLVVVDALDSLQRRARRLKS